MAAAPVRVCVIMAGGSGERFWPLSRAGRPKQLLPLGRTGSALLHEAMRHARGIVPAERVFIATSEALRRSILDSCPDVPAENVLAEPARRNTAGCLTYATALLLDRLDVSPETLTLGILTADHHMEPDSEVEATLRFAIEAAEQFPALVVIGIPATRPDTGFGYIEPAEFSRGSEVLPVRRFRDKPDLSTAEQFVASGRFLWNSGMFFWRGSTFLEQLARTSPVHYQALCTMQAALRKQDEPTVRQVFSALPDQPIDVALLEKADPVMMVRARFAWDDIGTWASLGRVLPCDARGNVAYGDPVLIDTQDCVVYNAPGPAHTAVGVLGVRDLVVVVDKDAVLVIPKDRVQEVRSILDRLKNRNAPQV